MLRRNLEWKVVLYIYSDYLEYFTTIGHILWAVGNFLSALVYCTEKNLATLEWGSFKGWRRIGCGFGGQVVGGPVDWWRVNWKLCDQTCLGKMTT
jgi:hypothetical protein